MRQRPTISHSQRRGKFESVAACSKASGKLKVTFSQVSQVTQHLVDCRPLMLSLIYTQFCFFTTGLIRIGSIQVQC